jgi:hypothetical protein
MPSPLRGRRATTQLNVAGQPHEGDLRSRLNQLTDPTQSLRSVDKITFGGIVPEDTSRIRVF